jgi:hypothetical protein
LALLELFRHIVGMIGELSHWIAVVCSMLHVALVVMTAAA